MLALYARMPHTTPNLCTCREVHRTIGVNMNQEEGQPPQLSVTEVTEHLQHLARKAQASDPFAKETRQLLVPLPATPGVSQYKPFTFLLSRLALHNLATQLSQGKSQTVLAWDLGIRQDAEATLLHIGTSGELYASSLKDRINSPLPAHLVTEDELSGYTQASLIHLISLAQRQIRLWDAFERPEPSIDSR